MLNANEIQMVTRKLSQFSIRIFHERGMPLEARRKARREANDLLKWLTGSWIHFERLEKSLIDDYLYEFNRLQNLLVEI